MTTRHGPKGPLVSANVVANLLRINPDVLDDLIHRGAVRTERIKGNLFIDLDDAERAVKATRGGGAE